MPEVFVGIGSNIDAELNLREALAKLRARFGEIEVSSVYRSPAFGFEGDDFLNIVVGFGTSLAAAEVDAALSAIEYAGGRVRAPSRFAPRTLDLDLLIHGGCVDPRQRLPRDDVLAYPFVLGPLAEIAPDLVHPIGGQRIADAWRVMRGRVALERIGPSTMLEDAARA
jgi:2-amino-4-hydroxy-6-hydroxymethyldihydropteridine diphosphokinase